MHRLHSPSIKSYEFSFKLSIYVARLHENRISASTLALRLYAVYPSESSSYLLLRWISFICTLKVLDVVQSGEWNWWQFYAYMYDYEGLQSKIFSLYSCMCVCMSVSVIFVLRERLALSAFFKSFHVIATEMT